MFKIQRNTSDEGKIEIIINFKLIFLLIKTL